MTKEWKGNKDSVRTRLAINKQHTTKGRETDDFYATDPQALELLLDKCSHVLRNRFMVCEKGNSCGFFIWEPACGEGNLSEVLKQRGYRVISSDLKDRGYGTPGKDFLKMSGDIYIQLIITNPPYSLATQFIEHALEILPYGGMYVALMSLNYLAGQKRYERIYSKGSLQSVYIFRKRIECWKNNDKEQFGGKAMADYAWYVFEKGYNGTPLIYWL